MSNIFITSDWHFNHCKPFIYEVRGFTSVKEMNAEIVARHNSVVLPEDDVYVLGDLMLGGSDKMDEGLALIAQMNGRLHIVRGNHDTNKRWSAFPHLPNVIECANTIYLDYKKYHFYLSHYPTQTSNFDNDKPLKQRLINLCGHTHTKDPWLDWVQHPIFHCEVDVNNCYPINLDTITENIKEMERRSKNGD